MLRFDECWLKQLYLVVLRIFLNNHLKRIEEQLTIVAFSEELIFLGQIDRGKNEILDETSDGILVSWEDVLLVTKS